MTDKVRVLVLGLGNFGSSWATRILPTCSDFADLVAVVDKQEEKLQRVDDSIPKYLDLETALDEIQPELVINVTTPDMHCKINELLLKRNIPVLCEKPISDQYEEAVRIGEVMKETNGFLMIAENYRYHAVFREARNMLQSGLLGKIHHVQCHFKHEHGNHSVSYHGALKHPLLEDIAIHHLDVARFLSGEEPEKVWCKEYPAPYCWYDDRPATAIVVTEMSGDVVFRYDATLAAPVSTTDWHGDWEIECDKGVLMIKNSHLFLNRDGNSVEVPLTMNPADSRAVLLQEACEAIREKRKGETDYLDNFKSYNWMEKTIMSAEKNEWINIK